jgi:hypothetical protein
MADQSSPAVDAANETLAGLRLSIDSNGNGLPSLLSSPRVPQVNGTKSSGRNESGQVALLQEELERTRAEKGALDSQYHSLLEKVTAMRTTLGNKLRQDAVCKARQPTYSALTMYSRKSSIVANNSYNLSQLGPTISKSRLTR